MLLTFMLARRNYYIEINFPLLFYSMVFILICAVLDVVIVNLWISLIAKLLLWGGWMILGIWINLVNVDIIRQASSKIMVRLQGTK